MTDYKLVPVEPTERMLDAIRFRVGSIDRDEADEIYYLILSSSPAVQGEPVGIIPRPVIDWAETGAQDYRDSWSTRINGHTVGLHSDEERARNHAWALEAYLGMHKIRTQPELKLKG